MEAGWTYGDRRDDGQKKHNRLKPYSMLDNYEKETYREPIRWALQGLIALGWQIEYGEADYGGSNARGAQQVQINAFVFVFFI
jgi:hypothetical protein